MNVPCAGDRVTIVASPLALTMIEFRRIPIDTVQIGEGFAPSDLAVMFVKPVPAGDTPTIRGHVEEKLPEEDRTRIVVESWCENPDGIQTMVREGSGLAASRNRQGMSTARGIDMRFDRTTRTFRRIGTRGSTTPPPVRVYA